MATGSGRFQDKAALVTGGASGIGLAVVEALRAEGADVLVVDRDGDRASAVAERTGARAHAADVSDRDAMRGAAEDAEKAFGRLDVAHLNAGVTTGETVIDQLSTEAYRRALSVNVDGVVFGVQAVAPVMERSGGGSIVVTGSLASLVAYPVDPIYALTKHAVMGFVRGVAQQLIDRGIVISVVCPGFVRTPLLGEEYAGMFDNADFPLLEPEEVGATVLTAAATAEPGAVYVCQPGRTNESYKFRGVPGPRTADKSAVGAPPEPGRTPR
jgi:NAD(P)-dependent dehydrogenase (short-subunit alcohol dehydrogenase family)